MAIKDVSSTLEFLEELRKLPCKKLEYSEEFDKILEEGHQEANYKQIMSEISAKDCYVFGTD